MDSDFKIRLKDKYKGTYIKTGMQKKINNVWYTEVVCPHCSQSRYIRRRLLSKDNKQSLKSTLCIKCNGMSEQVFNTDNIDSCYTILEGKKIYVDFEDIDRIKYYDLNILQNNYVEIRKHSKNNKCRGLLHRFILNIDNDNLVVDHINHNTLDNRKNNLRVCTQSDNGVNMRLPISNSSGFKNIQLINETGRQQKWQVQYIINEAKKIERFYTFLDAYSFLRNQCGGNFEYKLLEDTTLDLRYAGLQECDVSNGTGVGVTFFTQYCSHRCIECQNPQTWAKDGGYIFDKKVYDKLFQLLNKPYIKRLTLSGGDPLDNLKLSNLIASEFKYYFPNKQLWIYTGYTYEYLRNKYEYQAILELSDYLVDGEYIAALKDPALAFRGSGNQRIINMNKTRENNGKVILWTNS